MSKASKPSPAPKISTSKTSTAVKSLPSTVPLLMTIYLNATTEGSSLSVSVFKPVHDSLQITVTRFTGTNPKFFTCSPTGSIDVQCDQIPFFEYNFCGSDECPLEILSYLYQSISLLSSEERLILIHAIIQLYHLFFSNFSDPYNYLTELHLDASFLNEIPLSPHFTHQPLTVYQPVRLETLPPTANLKKSQLSKSPTAPIVQCKCKFKKFLCIQDFGFFQTKIAASYCSHTINIDLTRTISPTSSFQTSYTEPDNIPDWFDYKTLRVLLTPAEWFQINTKVQNKCKCFDQNDQLAFLQAAQVKDIQPMKLVKALTRRWPLTDVEMATLYHILNIKPTEMPWLLSSPVYHSHTTLSVEQQLCYFFVEWGVLAKSPTTQSYEFDYIRFFSITSSLGNDARPAILKLLPMIAKIIETGFTFTMPQSTQSTQSIPLKSISLQEISSELTPKVTQKSTLACALSELASKSAPEHVPPASSQLTSTLSLKSVFSLLDDIALKHPSSGKLFQIDRLNTVLSVAFEKEWKSIVAWIDNNDNNIKINCGSSIFFRGNQIITLYAICAAVQKLYG